MAERTKTYVTLSGADCVTSVNGLVIGEIQSVHWKYSNETSSGIVELHSTIFDGGDIKLDCAHKTLIITCNPLYGDLSYLCTELGKELESECEISINTAAVTMIQRYKMFKDMKRTYLGERLNNLIKDNEVNHDSLRDYVQSIGLRDKLSQEDSQIMDNLMTHSIGTVTLSWIDYFTRNYNVE